jgi:hypothetical protein
MSGQHYEFRVSGWLSEPAKSAFAPLDVTEIPQETIISGTLNDDGQMHEVLALIQSLGLHVVSVQRLQT